MPPLDVVLMAGVDGGMRGNFGSRPVDVVAEMPRVKRTYRCHKCSDVSKSVRCHPKLAHGPR